MKFQLKALAAALVLVAAVPAQAAIAPGSTGNGELVLTVWDQVTNISATFDLGKTYSEFSVSGTAFPNSGVTADNTAFSWSLSGDAGYSSAWGQFLAASTSANTVYAIGSVDSAGGGQGYNGARGFITSYAGTPNPSTTSGQILNAVVNFDAYTNGTSFGPSVLFENHSLVANGSSVANAGDGYAFAQYNAGSNTGRGVRAIGAIGSNLQVAQYVTGASSFVQAPFTVFGNGAKFNLTNAGLLTYSTNVTAVPEADTWAMMLLGLGFMGFVARRKQA